MVEFEALQARCHDTVTFRFYAKSSIIMEYVQGIQNRQ